MSAAKVVVDVLLSCEDPGAVLLESVIEAARRGIALSMLANAKIAGPWELRQAPQGGEMQWWARRNLLRRDEDPAGDAWLAEVDSRGEHWFAWAWAPVSAEEADHQTMHETQADAMAGAGRRASAQVAL